MVFEEWWIGHYVFLSEGVLIAFTLVYRTSLFFSPFQFTMKSVPSRSIYHHFVLLCFCLYEHRNLFIYRIHCWCTLNHHHNSNPFSFVFCMITFLFALCFSWSLLSCVFSSDSYNCCRFPWSICLILLLWLTLLTFECNRRDLQFMNASNECNSLYFLSLRHLPWVLLYIP